MIPHTLKVKRLPHCKTDMPIRPPSISGDVGYDLCANIDTVVTIGPHQSMNIGTGIAVEIDTKFPFSGLLGRLLGRFIQVQAEVRPRSSTYFRRKLTVEIGTIDVGYRGEISAFVVNNNPHPVSVFPGDYLAQLVVTLAFVPKVKYVSDLSDSERGTAGFGSTGGYEGKPKVVGGARGAA